LTITCGFSRGRFLLYASPFASEQDEDIERRDSLLTINFSSGFAAILVLAVTSALFVDSFGWLVFLLGVDRSAILRDDSCSLAETVTTIFDVGRFCLPAEGSCRVVEFFPDESTLIRASPRFCEDSAGDPLSLLHDCSCSLLVKRGLSLLVACTEEASVLATWWLPSDDPRRSPDACRDDVLTTGGLSILENSRTLLGVGGVEEQTRLLATIGFLPVSGRVCDKHGSDFLARAPGSWPDSAIVLRAIGSSKDERARRCLSRLLQNLSRSDLMFDTLSACAKHCSCLGLEGERYGELSINRVFAEYSLRVLLWREDFLRGGEGGLGAGIACVRAPRGALIADDSSVVVVVVVVVRGVVGVVFFLRIVDVQRCTRILVRVGEIGKYSISESSVDRVSGFWSLPSVPSETVGSTFTLFLPCHPKVAQSRLKSPRSETKLVTRAIVGATACRYAELLVVVLLWLCACSKERIARGASERTGSRTNIDRLSREELVPCT